MASDFFIATDVCGKDVRNFPQKKKKKKKETKSQVASSLLSR